jgi:hypothetical protein
MKSHFLTIVAMALLCLSQPAWGDGQTVWPRRVLVAAQYLTGDWSVEGSLGRDQWVGKWSCEFIPGRLAYTIDCYGSRLGENQSAEHLTLLRGVDVQAAYQERSCLDGRHRVAVRPTPNEIVLDKVSVARRSSNEFVWKAPTVQGELLTFVFRRIEATPAAGPPPQDQPELVPARPVEDR